MIVVDWPELVRIIESLNIVVGLIAGVLALAFLMTRLTVLNFVVRKWVLLVSAGLTLGGVFSFALAFQRTNGHPSVYNALLWIGLTCFITAGWRLIRRPSV